MKIKVYIHAPYNEYEKCYDFKAWGMDMSSQAGCGPLVDTQEIEFTPPPRDVLINGTILQYREQQRQIRAQGEKMINEIQRRIDDLLCIEYKPETVAE